MMRGEEKRDQVFIMNIKETMQADYMDGDIIIINNIQNIPGYWFVSKSQALNVFSFVICTQGKLQVRIMSKTVVIHPCEVLYCDPSTVINDYMISPDFDAIILCMSPHIVQSILYTNRNIWNHYFNISQNPVLNIGEEGLCLFKYYCQLLVHHIKFPQQVYNKEAMYSLVSALLYDLLAKLGNTEIINNNIQISQGDILFKRFIELLSKSEPKERSVSYYAEQLCITPKYLSSTVKKVSGKTAFEWINEFVIEDVKRQLSFSNKSIKEVADYLLFPNISFFGKYVRTHLGMSPTEFRRQIGRG